MPRGYIQRRLAQALGCALEDLHSEPSASSAHDEAAAQSPAPVPPRRFVGREAALAQLGAAMREGGRVVIEGASGVGKTALASVFASNASHLYPDGVVFVDLQGGGDPLPARRAMRHLLGSLLSAPVIVDTHVELHAAYRAALREKRVLLILDNAADSAQIAPLIPPLPSAVIVTSRQSLASLDLDPLVLEPLARGASIELLRSHGCATEHAERLSAVCGDLPLVLTVVAREAARADCDVSELLRELEREPSRIRALDAISPAARISASLERGIAMLAPELRKRLALLQVFPQDLDRASAARVWDVEPAQALAMLRELSMRHLVQHCSGRGKDARYRVHDLVRIAVARHANEAELLSARFRHARHYLALLRPPDRLARAAEDDLAEVAQRIHADAANLYAALSWCTRRAPDCTDTALLLSGVQRVQALDLVLGPVAHRDAYRSVVDRPAGSSERAWMPQLCLKLGDLCRIEGDYETATRALERAVREMGDAGNPHLDLLAGITLGLTYVQQGEMDRALSVIRPHARRARESRNGLWQSFALMVLGCVFLGHRIRRSEALFRASLAAGEKQVNALVRSEAKSGLSSCLARRGELRQAFALAREALDEVRRVGPFPSSASREPVALTALAMVCLHADLEAATRYAEDALRIAETGAPGHVRVRALYVRASVALASPSWLDAAPFVDAALQIDASLQPYAHRAAARHLAAQFMVRAQRFDEALALLESLIEPEPAGRIGARKDCEARLSVADLLALLGRSAAARDHAATVLRWISRFRLQGDRALVARTQALHARLGRADAA